MVVWEALDALSHQLELCRIDASSVVVVLLDSTSSETQAALVRAAVARTGATAAELRPLVRASSTDIDDHELVAAMVQTATVTITVGTRRFDTLLNEFDANHLHLHGDVSPSDYPPHDNLRRRVTALTKQLRNADTLQITDPHGTNLTVDLRRSKSDFDHGLVGSDRHVSTFPAGWVGAVPASTTVQGDLVLMPGDANLNAHRHISSPLRLQIQNDLITTIEGDTPDADVIRALLEYVGDPSAYGVATVAMGMNPGPRALTTFDPQLLDPRLCRLAAGVVSVSFGNNLVADRPCSQTITFGLPKRSVQLDGLAVITHGVLEGDFAPDVYEL